MQVSKDYFENGITYFTNLIYSAIRFAVGSGETAPFVGHNAFLRWQGKHFAPELMTYDKYQRWCCSGSIRRPTR
jgi:hypothetical protein